MPGDVKGSKAIQVFVCADDFDGDDCRVCHEVSMDLGVVDLKVTRVGCAGEERVDSVEGEGADGVGGVSGGVRGG